jgi:hypothetical protein
MSVPNNIYHESSSSRRRNDIILEHVTDGQTNTPKDNVKTRSHTILQTEAKQSIQLQQ